MREVDELQHAVHHRVAEGDQRVDRTLDEAVASLVPELVVDAGEAAHARLPTPTQREGQASRPALPSYPYDPGLRPQGRGAPDLNDLALLHLIEEEGRLRRPQLVLRGEVDVLRHPVVGIRR